ncbi:MAG TPA: glycosyltransferase family 4 protein [Thermoanaerobaculia bacterium]|nr:glycosyltransferase family 4 protein [Thermoanaerobaculia bacterium]
MTRVLLVCPEPLHGQPAGIGIRFLEMANVLRADAHRVTIIAPSGGDAPLTPMSLLEQSQSHDCAVVQGHVANDFFAHARPLPTVVDLYDPFIVENLHYFGERGAEVFSHDHRTLVQSVVRGDFFLCASEAQRLFYLGLLLATGRVNPELFAHDPRFRSLIAVAPFGVAPAEARETRENFDILFGGIYDWYDPILAIDAVARARESLPQLTLTFTRHPNPDITPQGKLAEAIAHAKKHRYDFVQFAPWVPYAERGAFFARFTLALLTFPQSIETDLAMRTRIYDFLWGALPVVTSSAPGTDELLLRYRAGSVIRDESADAFARELVALFRDRAKLGAMREGATQFTREHQWRDTLAPLREFCAAPRFDETKARWAATIGVPEQPPTLAARVKRRIRRFTT